MKSVYSLRYELISTRSPAPVDISKIEDSFSFWKNSWESTYRTLNVNERKEIRSDDFLDREVGALFHDNQPVGLFFNNWFDISRDSVVAHSYFKNYPNEVIKFYRDQGLREVMILSYMTLHPERRKSETDVQISDVLFSLGVLRFMNGQWPALIGYIRKDNGTDRIFYRHGGIKVLESTAYNVPVDFCYLTHESAKLSDQPGAREAALFLWENMIRESKQKEKNHGQKVYRIHDGAAV